MGSGIRLKFASALKQGINFTVRNVKKLTRSLVVIYLAGLELVFGLVVFSEAHGEEPLYYERYRLAPDSPTVDVGIQPLGYPSGVLTAVIRHDEILKAKLLALAQPIQLHPFRRGADMLPLLADGRLDAALIGDMPTLLAAVSDHIWIVGLAKQSPTAIVAREQTQLRGLAGKRIAYVEASSAHQTLLQGLSSAGLKEADVRLLPMRVDEMPDALKRGDIDAFAAWEPAPSIALAANEMNRIIFRGLSSDYFVIRKSFARQSPAAVEALIAGYVRAIEWLRLSQKNIERAAAWAQADTEQFAEHRSSLPVALIVAITRREILNIPSAPSIIRNLNSSPPLLGEFEFLKRLGKLPANSKWENIANALNNDLMAGVLANPRHHQTNSFDYRD